MILNSLRAFYLFPRFLLRKREWVFATVGNNIRQQYRNSLLGFIWLFLPSIIKILIYYTVFSTVLSGRIPGTDGRGFIVYLIIGILSWDVFSSTLAVGSRMFIENRGLILAGVFQKSMLPVFRLIESWVSIIILFPLLVIIAWHLNTSSVVGLVQILFLLFCQQILSIAIALVLSIYRVYFDDIDHLVAVTIQAWFWATPIVYPIEILPDLLERLVKILNPFYPFVDLYHELFVFSGIVPWFDVLRMFGFSSLFSLGAIMIYLLNRRRLENML